MKIAALAFMTLLPVALSVGLCFLERRLWAREIGHGARQVIVGVLFGLLAVMATEAGISVSGAPMILCSGLSVMLSLLLVSLIGKEKVVRRRPLPSPARGSAESGEGEKP